jgi:N-acetylneuraminic acid mutarotase
MILYNSIEGVDMRSLIVVLLVPFCLLAISWTTKTPLPVVRSAPGCAVINDTVYVIGGASSGGTLHNTNYIYDPVADSWSTKASMPTARSQLGCAVVNGKIYAIGGFVGGIQTDTNLVEEYDPATDSWSTKAPMPTSRYAFAIAVVANKIYVIGGMLPIVAIVEEYNPTSNSWATKTSMPTARMGPASAVIRDTIYVFGGSTSTGTGATTVNECYDPSTDHWASKAAMVYNRYGLGGFAYNNSAYAIGGYNYSVYRDNVEVYDPAINTWQNETPMQYARQSMAVGLVGNAVYVIGGWNNGPLSYNEEGILTIGIKEYQKSQAMSLTIEPNPFSTATKISWRNISDSEQFELYVYDVTGRLVRSFGRFSTQHSCGNEIVWDGKDDAGAALPSGNYLFVVNISGKKVSKVLSLIRE